MSQDRMNTPETQRMTSGSDYQAPDIDATLSRASSTLNKIRVVNGANEQYFDNLSGKTVGSVRKSLREVFNIPGDASALVGGKEVGDDFILEGGMNLEFLKEAGVKGAKTVSAEWVRLQQQKAKERDRVTLANESVAPETPKKRVFLRNMDSGEPASYCGDADDMADVVKSIGHMLAAELPELHDDEDAIDYRIEFKEMTDQEVKDLPDL